MDKLEKPIFIKENIIRPMFNEEFTKELTKKIAVCKDYLSDQELAGFLQSLTHELIEINNKLLKTQNSFTHSYSYWEFECVNGKSQIDIEDCSNHKPIISEETANNLLYAYRKLNELMYDLGEEYVAQIKSLMFISKLILEVYRYSVQIMDM